MADDDPDDGPGDVDSGSNDSSGENNSGNANGDHGGRADVDHGPDRTERDQSSHLDTSNDSLGDRATGEESEGAPPNERATGESGSELFGGQDPLGVFNDGKQTDSAFHLLDKDPGQLLLEGLDTQPGERALDWMGQDVEALESGIQALKDFVADFFAAIGDFLANYHEMIAVNTKGADRFFHCQANCQAASRGLGGLLAAKTISYGREATDLPKNAMKGISWKDNLADCKGDLAADRAGWDAGSRGLRCNDACNGYRPRGL